MRLLPNWTSVLLRAWSMWAFAALVAVEVLREVEPYFEIVLPRWLSILLVISVPILRAIAQKGLSLPGVSDDEELWS